MSRMKKYSWVVVCGLILSCGGDVDEPTAPSNDGVFEDNTGSEQSIAAPSEDSIKHVAQAVTGCSDTPWTETRYVCLGYCFPTRYTKRQKQTRQCCTVSGVKTCDPWVNSTYTCVNTCVPG